MAIMIPVGFLYDPASGPVASTCPGGNPEIIVKVSNLGATETINWAGNVWNLPGDNNKEYVICPTSGYVKGRGYHTTLTYSGLNNYRWWTATHRWNGPINMFIDYVVTYSIFAGSYRMDCCGFNNAGLVNSKGLNIGLGEDRIQIYNSFGGPTRPVFPNAYFSYLYQLGVLNNAYLATYSNYPITDDFFGSYSSASVTYTWSRGAGW